MYAATFHADYSRLEGTAFSRKYLQRLELVVVGAGALGNEVCRVLGLLGVGHVIVVDPDTVEASNLPRSIFFCRSQAIHRNKAEVLIETAGGMFPDTRWSSIPHEIADVGFQNLAEANLIFSCVDSDLARLEIAYISSRLRIAVADAGLGRSDYSHGRVTFFPGRRDRACYACMLTPAKRRELLSFWEATLRPCASGDPTEMDSVSTPTMAAIIGSLQVESGLRAAVEMHDGSEVTCRSVEVDIHPAHRIREFTIPVSADCPFHDFDDCLQATSNQDQTFSDLLDRSASDVLMLDWPICTEAECLVCGKRWSPMRRLASLRRRGHCPACHAEQNVEVSIVRSVDRNSKWLHSSPSELGLPPRHLYSFRRTETIAV